MKEKKKIVILGGSYGGVNAAKVLYKKLKNQKEIEITLIDKNPYHTLMTELHEVAGGRAEPESVLVSHEKIFGGMDIRLVIDHIQTVDFNGQKLISETAEYPYDYLVIGAGAEPDYFDIPGAREHTLPLWSFENALKIREHIEFMFRKAAKEANPAKRKKLLTFVIVGGGFTGVEMAGELLEWKNSLCVKNGISPKDVRVIVVEALDAILSILPQKLQKKAATYFTKKGGEILTKSPITGITPEHVTVKDGNTIETKTVIWTCGVQGCEFGANLSLKKGKCVFRKYPENLSMDANGKKEQCSECGKYINGKLGRLEVNEFMEAPEKKNVYIVGDMAWFEEKGKPIPQIVETALQTSETAAHNIIADLQGRQKKAFKSDYHGLMVSVGGRYAVAHVMNMSLTGFFAMAMKHLINLHYLIGVAGINACWDYIKHHFLDIRDNRSIIGGHASAKVRIYWVAALRLFLGVMWLVEGSTKVIDGWLDPSKIYIVNMAAISNGTTDAQMGATEMTEGQSLTQEELDAMASTTPAGETWAAPAADAVSTATAATAPQAEKPLLDKPLGLYVWFQENVMVKAPFVFQATVVIAEILIGLALLGGLFTSIAAAGSIGLCLMFIVSAMASKEIFWYMISAIAVIGGGGRGFGLDYWVMPWLQKWWNRTKIAKKTYLYLDEPRK
jgi:NADH dehydrogenase